MARGELDKDALDRNALAESFKASVFRRLSRYLEDEKRLPEGTVTILFTDVEGSSELLRDLGEERARAVLRRHDELVREAIESHDGAEVERAGDSFMAAFASARRAVACALEIQRVLDQPDPFEPGAPIMVRIGMDTGEVISEEKGYFGSTVFRAARIAEMARGGKILASEATKVLAAPGGYGFLDIGVHELKGLGDGHQLFEVTAHLAESPPAAGSG